MARPLRGIAKDRVDLMAFLKRNMPDYDPILELCKIATDYKNNVDTRLNANKEVAKYVYPQLRAVEVSPGAGASFKAFVIEMSDEKS